MTEQTESVESETPPEGEQVQEQEQETFDREYVEKLRKEAAKYRTKAADNAKAAQELEEFRRQSMTDTEKAIDQARTEARQQALADVGGKVAAAEFRAAAAGRMADEQVGVLLENLNLARFIDDVGEVDRDAVAAFVDGVAPTSSREQVFPDLGQGARGTGATGTSNNMDSLLRAAVKGRT